MAKIRYVLYVDPDVPEAIRKVAEADGMEGPAFASLVLSKVSQLKNGEGLTALTSIPRQLFKSRPGRPPTTATPAERHEETTPQHVT
jgi:hypothetical protein